jgi:mono/diheme cytochrome c family protein
MRKRPQTSLLVMLPLVVATVATAASCQNRSDLREWTPGDHDQPATPPQGQGPRQKAARQDSDSGSLVEVAWGRNCTPCHGSRGAGDGPQGPMMRAPDLTRTDWQDKVTDDEIAQVIRSGRNKMPKFDLPPAVLEGIVRRIRTNRAR